MILYPDNRNPRHSFSSLSVRMAGQLALIGFKALSYDDTLAGTKVYGVHPQPIGRTRGIYEATASIEMYKAEWDAFQKTLGRLYGGNGFKEESFDIVACYYENGYDLITDTIQGCRVEKNPAENSQGADALSVKVQLSPMLILWNGKNSLRKPL